MFEPVLSVGQPSYEGGENKSSLCSHVISPNIHGALGSFPSTYASLTLLEPEEWQSQDPATRFDCQAGASQTVSLRCQSVVPWPPKGWSVQHLLLGCSPTVSPEVQL